MFLAYKGDDTKVIKQKDNIIKSDDIAKSDIAITYNIRKKANCTTP